MIHGNYIKHEQVVQQAFEEMDKNQPIKILIRTGIKENQNIGEKWQKESNISLCFGAAENQL